MLKKKKTRARFKPIQLTKTELTQLFKTLEKSGAKKRGDKCKFACMLVFVKHYTFAQATRETIKKFDLDKLSSDAVRQWVIDIQSKYLELYSYPADWKRVCVVLPAREAEEVYEFAKAVQEKIHLKK